LSSRPESSTRSTAVFSSPPSSRADRFRLSWLLIAVATVVSLGVVVMRWNYENANTQAQLTVDYDDTRGLADAYQIPQTQLLRELHQRGITSIGLYEQSLASLRNSGRLAITAREEAERLYPSPVWAQAPASYRFLVSTTPENADLLPAILPRLTEQSQPSTPPLQVELGRNGETGVLIPNSPLLIGEALVGFDPLQIEQARDAGLSVTARISNPQNLNPARMRTLLDDAVRARAKIVLFSEEEVLGYDSLIKETGDEMKKRGLLFGNIEFGKQSGWDDFSKNSDGLLVRVHSVGGLEAGKMKTEVLEDRYVRGIKERNIRVAYIRLMRQLKGEPAETAGVKTTGKSALQQNLDFVQAISNDLKLRPLGGIFRPAMSLGSAQAFDNYPIAWLAPHVGGTKAATLLSYLLRFLAGLGAVGGVLLLLNLFFDLSRRTETMWLIVGLVIVGGMALSAGMGAKLIALVVGCVFSAVGVLWGGLPQLWDRLHSNSTEKTQPTVWNSFTEGFGILIRTSLITMIGPILIIALLNQWKFMSGTDKYLLPKATQLLPLLWVALAFSGDVFPHRVLENGATAARLRARERFANVLRQPFTVRIAVTSLLLFMAGSIWIARSGNDSGMEISPLELKMRAFLEQTLVTRPRTKELFIGMPAAVFAVWFMCRRQWLLAFGAVMLVTIGQADLLNTFCHIHTPIFYSVLRSIHGIWIGAIVGGIALWVWNTIEKMLAQRGGTSNNTNTIEYSNGAPNASNGVANGVVPVPTSADVR